jgi:hypothetical protein
MGDASEARSDIGDTPGARVADRRPAGTSGGMTRSVTWMDPVPGLDHQRRETVFTRFSVKKLFSIFI